MIYYKIRKKDDPEMYVSGTPYYQSYDRTGRIFQKIGPLRTFLTCVMNSDSRSDSGRNRVAEWEVVELEMIVKDVKGIHEVITSKKLKELIMK